MKKIMLFAAGISGTLAASSVQADAPRYDRKLEEAAMRIVAENIGDIRDGFKVNEKPIMLNDMQIRIATNRKSQSLGGFQRPAVAGSDQ